MKVRSGRNVVGLGIINLGFVWEGGEGRIANCRV